MSEFPKEFPLGKEEAARLLAERGEAANRDAARGFSELRGRFQDAPLFSVAVVEWLAQCFPLERDEMFFKRALSYMEENGEAAALEDYGQIPLLSEAATLWRIILITQDASSITDAFSATDIWLYQEIVLNAAGLLGIRKMPKGIGPWLFLGPFKLLGAWKPEHWASVELANLLYPFGAPELAALASFKARGADWLGKNLDRILQITEQNFSTASATLTMAQDIQRDLAASAGSHLIHVNAGLRALGSSLIIQS